MSFILYDFVDVHTITVTLVEAGIFEITSVILSKPAGYTAGENVILVIAIKNTAGFGSFAAKIYDNDTGIYIVGIGDTLDAGATLAYTVTVGTMPKKNWNLRINVNP